MQQLRLLRSSLCTFTIIITVKEQLCSHLSELLVQGSTSCCRVTWHHTTTQHTAVQTYFRPVIALVFICVQIHESSSEMCKGNEGCCSAVHSFPSDIQIWWHATVLYSKQLPTFQTPKQHRWQSLTSRNMQIIILQVGPNANCPLFLFRLTTVPKFFLPKLPHFKQIRSQPSAVLNVARHGAAEWRILQRFLAYAERNYRVPVAETTPLRLSFRPLTLFTAVSLLYAIWPIFIRFSILSCACYIPSQPRLLCFYHVSNPWHGEQFS